MIRQLVFVALLAGCSFAAPIENYEDIPAEYKELIPKDVVEHIKSITPEEKAVLKEVATNYANYKTEDEFLAAIKEKSPTLHEKVSKLHQLVKDRVDGLGDEAKEFVKKVIADARKLHAQVLAGTKPSLVELKTLAKTHLDGYAALSPEAKEQFKKQFPILTSIFSNEKVKGMIDQHINN